MKAALRFVRKWWWVVLAGLAALLTIVGKVLSRPKSAPEPGPIETSQPKKTLVEKARDQVEKVHLEGEVEKAKIQTVAKSQMNEIKAIEEVGKTDPKKAREQLADFLASNL